MTRARVRAGMRWTIAIAALCAATTPAFAQGNRGVQTIPPNRYFEFRVPATGPREGEREAAPLRPEVVAQLARARQLMQAGKLDAARDTLLSALTLAPHHPALLLELANVHQARGAWRAVEQLARAERSSARDSLLLAQDLVTALRRMDRPRDAAQVVIEAWVASPGHLEWARTTLDTLAALDSKGVRETVRRAATDLPQRVDIVGVAAGLEWKLGDAQAALQLLNRADATFRGAPLRWSFADELLGRSTARDSAGAIEVLMDLAADRSRDLNYRLVAAQRAWETYARRGSEEEAAPRVAHALEDVPPGRWGSTLAIAVIRGLRSAGATDEARRLLRVLGERGRRIPEIAIEYALNDLRDGPPERALGALQEAAGASNEGAFRYAEALFFAGQPDSAMVWYGKAAQNAASPFTGAALERMYLIEDADPKGALVPFGRLAYEEWRGEPRRAIGLADSLYGALPHGSMWAVTAVRLAALREATGNGKEALEPLLALAEGLPDDRLAPLARQRAGDVYRVWYRDDAKALEQYEECLARYPKAWNTPEVRRWVETLRRERRF